MALTMLKHRTNIEPPVDEVNEYHEPRESPQRGRISKALKRSPAPAPVPIDGNPVVEQETKESKRELLFRAIMSEDLFISNEKSPYITINDNGTFKTYPVHSNEFKHYLEHRYYKLANTMLTGKLCTEMMDSIASNCHQSGRMLPVHYRVAEHDGKFYLDLINDNHDVVEISADGWRITNTGAVKFRRNNSSMPLPTPVQCDDAIGMIEPLINITNTDHLRLVIGFLVACLTPRGPYPILVINSRHDSGKTVTTRNLRTLIDPCTAPVSGVPSDAKSAMLTAANSHIMAIDNVSTIQPWLSDTLCHISSGCGFRQKKLYSDIEEVVVNAQSAIILNSIQDVITNPDLGDRCLFIELPPIKPSCRLSDSEIKSLLNKNHPQILGWLLNCVSWYLATFSSFERPETIYRMVDYYRIMHVLESHLGWPPMSFAVAYSKNRRSIMDAIIDKSVISRHVIAFMDNKERWEGSAINLLRELNRIAPPGEQMLKDWPKTPEAISRMLRAITPNLEEYRIMVSFRRQTDRNRARVITMVKTDENEDGAGVEVDGVVNEGAV
jgi:hypothetical protein